jgi:hypothetical protein
MLQTLRRATLALVFAGLGFAVLYRRDRTPPRPASDGWVELSFDA